MDYSIVFLLLLFVAAFLYSTVGHGGASGYLALMALFGFAPETMRPTAFVLNIFVSLIAFIQYYRSGNFIWQKFLPFAIASVPAAYLGSLLPIGNAMYKHILGIMLLIAAMRFMGVVPATAKERLPQTFVLAVCIGAAIGVVSGMIGIGGGIVLSPLLLLFGWADLKQTAAISAAFIFVNSVAGLGGLLSRGVAFNNDMLLWVVVAFAGGMAGAYLGAHRFNSSWLRYILVVVLVIAAVKLFM